MLEIHRSPWDDEYQVAMVRVAIPGGLGTLAAGRQSRFMEAK